MADRHPAFPMLQQNFNGAGLMPHQQTPFNHQQAQQQEAQVGALGGNDSQRLWQQMQQQRQQQQQQQQQQHLHQFSQQQQNGDIMGGNPTNQMADFMRNTGNLALQGQQPQAAQQQQFGAPPNQLNGQMGGGMHEFNTPQLMQHSLSGNNLGNMPFNSGGNPAVLQAAMQQRQLLQNGGPAVTRQLELLMAQQQQPQNGMVNNLAARIAAVQQRQQQQGGLGAMGQNPMMSQNPFSLASGGDNGPTGPIAGPSGGNGMPHQTPVPNPQDPTRTLSLDDLKAHAARLKHSIVQLDNETNSLINSKPDAEMQQRVNQLRQERLTRLNVLKKVIQAIQDMSRGQPMGNVMNPGNGPAGQPPTGLNHLGQGSHPTQLGAQNMWGSQGGPPQAQPFGSQIGAGMNSFVQGTQGAPGVLHDQSAQHPPQRAISTGIPPHPSLPPHVSPAPSNAAIPQTSTAQALPPTGDQQHPGAGGMQAGRPLSAEDVPPLEQTKFHSAYQNWCRQHNVQPDERLLTIGNRRVDLYQLHAEVRRAGGAEACQEKDLWPIIGGKLGFVQFPGTANVPAKSGPGIAQTLQHVFRQYLHQFEQVYINTYLNHQRIPRGTQPGAPPVQPPTQPGTAPQLVPNGLNVQQIAAMMQFANMTVEQMRQRGLPDKMIQAIERYRPFLQKQIEFRQSVPMPANDAGQQPMMSQPSPANMVARNGAPGMPTPFMNGQQQPPQPTPMMGGMRPGPSQSPPLAGGVSTAGLDAPFVPALAGGARQATPAAPVAAGNQLVPQPISSAKVQQVQVLIAQMKQSWLSTNDFSRTPHYPIPEEHKAAYLSAFEQLARLVADLDANLATYLAMFPANEIMRKMVIVIVTTREQQRLLASPTPRYILEPKVLSTLISQVSQYSEKMKVQLMALKNGQLPPQMPRQIPPQLQPNIAAPPVPPMPKPTPPPPHLGQPGIPPASMNRPVPINNPPPPKVRKNALVPGQAPSPPLTATTPQANAPTPTAIASAASPQTPKSPKPKQTPKPKPTPIPPANKVRKPSVSSAAKPGAAASAPTPEAMPMAATPTPAAATPTPVAAPTPTPSSSKRSREEDPAPVVDAPSPNKRIKVESEWDGPPALEVIKREEEVDNIKTSEDAVAFFEQMEKFIQSDQDSTLQRDVATSLAQILNGVPGGFDLGDPSLLDTADPSQPSASTANAPADDLLAFFDFSSFGEDDAGAASTPDLLPSSSANPSPESGSEGDHGPTHTPKLAPASKDENKTAAVGASGDDPDNDPFRLGAWAEIDGGETLHYMPTDGFKWSGTMPEATWAISTS